jgi:ankyrin repeat protein
VANPSRHHRFVRAALERDYTAMQDWLDKGADINFDIKRPCGTALDSAAYCNDRRLAEFLLARGADANQASKNYGSSLMAACSGRRNCAVVVRMLIDAGADVNLALPYDQYPLGRAAKNCTAEVVQLLLDAGAAIEGPRGAVKSPLMWAASAGNLETLQALIDNGADMKRGGGGERALGAAEQAGKRKVAAYLRSAMK